MVKLLKLFTILVAAVLISSIISLAATCRAIEIIKTHSGNITISVVSQTGESHEPAQCNSFPLIYGME